MTGKRWIKMPDGRLVRHRPDRLSLFLAENEPFLSVVPAFDRSPGGAGQPSQLQGYDAGVSGIGRIAGCEITMFGAGSVGTHLLYALGAALLSVNVIDFKKVQFKHTCGGRTIYEHASIGLRKVYAVKQKIERDFPGAKVNPYPYGAGEIPDIELRSMFERSLVVILAIDDPKQMIRISDLAYPIVELVQVAMHAGGLSGHIAVCVPFVTPCLRCTLEISGPQDIRRLDSEPANSLDIVAVAQQAARIVVDIMSSKVTGRHVNRWDTSKNLIYVANAMQELLSPEDGPGIHFEGSQKRPGCPVCDI